MAAYKEEVNDFARLEIRFFVSLSNRRYFFLSL